MSALISYQTYRLYTTNFLQFSLHKIGKIFFMSSRGLKGRGDNLSLRNLEEVSRQSPEIASLHSQLSGLLLFAPFDMDSFCTLY